MKAYLWCKRAILSYRIQIWDESTKRESQPDDFFRQTTKTQNPQKLIQNVVFDWNLSISFENWLQIGEKVNVGKVK